MAIRVLELFCGIGGCAAALAGGAADRDPRPGRAASVAAAIDINRQALAVYRHNFPHPTAARTLDSLGVADLERWDPDLWWLSPPCQPFTRRGLRRDDADPRSAALLHLVGLLDRAPPPALALENVPGFDGSRTHGRLREALDRLGYSVCERELCPSELGVPNRRRRFYLVAARPPWRLVPAAAATPPEPRPLTAFLDPDPAPELWPPADLPRRYRHAIDLVDAADPAAVTACFTAAYGRSPVRSGSYLATPRGPRRFSPTEILRLLGFPPDYRLPPDLPLANAWRLVGNSLSVDAVRTTLSCLPMPAEDRWSREGVRSPKRGAVLARRTTEA